MKGQRIGIDVGGTFTDAVILEGTRIVASAKRRTTKPRFMDGVLAALDAVMVGRKTEHIERVTLSTTVITNTVVEHKEEATDLYIIPGPGRNMLNAFPVTPIIWSGYTDHRGVMTAPTIPKIENPCGTRRAAISAKFAVRNPQSEENGAKVLREAGYEQVTKASSLSGRLNFPRRTVSAYFNSAVYGVFGQFIDSIQQALKDRGITAPLYILKADGGALPVMQLKERPVETVFTGPAASVLGMEALETIPQEQAVALDIGGTTTDISLWENSRPLMAHGGVAIREYPSAVRSFMVRSVGIGGESAVRISQDGLLTVGPLRLGPSVALGGSVPTLGDALIVLGYASYGDVTAAKTAIGELADEWNASHQADSVSPEAIARRIVKQAVQTIRDGIIATVDEQNKRPIYVVKDIVEAKTFMPTVGIAVGGTAPSLAKALEEGLGIPVQIPSAAAVANAVGAAVAKEIVDITVRVATETHTMVIPELGIQSRTSCRNLEEVRQRAVEHLLAYTKTLGIADTSYEITYEEEVPVVKGWQDVFYSITVCLQLQAGVTVHVQAED